MDRGAIVGKIYFYTTIDKQGNTVVILSFLDADAFFNLTGIVPQTVRTMEADDPVAVAIVDWIG